jgi:hypothetical protein
VSNAAAFAAMDRHLDFLRSLPNLARLAAPEVAAKCKELTDQHCAAGVDPYGQPWPASKDGRKVLRNAGAAVTLRAVGTVVYFTLSGVEVMHHIGNARGYHGGSKKLGGFRRTIIPFRGFPQPFRAVTKGALEERFQHLRRSGGRGAK